MNEKEFLQRIKNDAEDLEVPVSLHPDHIEEKLKNVQQITKPDSEPAKTIPFKSIKRYRKLIRFGSLAAVFALAFTALYSQDVLSPQTQSERSPRNTETAPLPAETTPSSLEDIYHILYNQFHYTEEEFYPGLGARLFGRNMVYEEEITVEDSSVTEEFTTGSSAEYSASESMDFSNTNIQEPGVDEGDIIKTDGTYLYILREDLSLAIVEAGDGNPRLISVTDLPDKNSGSVHEMYLDQDNLHIILSETVTELNQDADTYYTQTIRRTSLLTYDISNRKKPELSGQVTQDGSYSDSRKNGQYLYLFTRYVPDIQETYEDSTVAPLINGSTAEASDFYLPQNLTDNAYLVISSVDTAKPDTISDSKILVSGVSNFYVSKNNIYITNETYGREFLTTDITKFHYEDGQITGVGASTVKGYLNNSFSLNEHNGYLRVVSTYTDEALEEKNGLFIFDPDMNLTGSIENLADGETIRSARFFGDIGYFVTFRQTDPLFSADLSDPENPVILGQLKISGFSSYLHFYGENQLLGIGYEADETTGMTIGLKLSMFDISDPSNVTETNRFILENITWCPAIENYKSILVQPEKNLIGFYCDNRYLIFSYNPETGFSQELVYDFYSDNLTGEADYYNMRGLYIEDLLYLAGNRFVVTFDMKDQFQKEAILQIN